jgi:hypothetical protein
MKGRRREDVRLGELPNDVQPGDIWRYLNADGTPCSAKAMYGERSAGNLTDTVWGYMSPDGNGIGTLGKHTVRENDDGTVSVLPGDGTSNSILHSGGPTDSTWHGYIYDGEWRAC